MRDDTYVLNHCTPFLARSNKDRRHDFGFGHYSVDDDRARFREAWRFPVIDTCAQDGTQPAISDNDVTFIFPATSVPAETVSVVGTFGFLYQPQPLRRIEFLGEETDYFAATVRVPKRGVYFYRFNVDGQLILDPINPQRQMLENGVMWSRFFTWECSQPVVLQRHELSILERLCDHILPFRTREGQRFLSWYYDGLDTVAKQGVIRSAFRLDDSVGAANYIDKILAREESHHFIDYRKCLKQLDRILRQRDPVHDPGSASADLFKQIYQEMAAGSVNGWDTADYGSPQHFLDLVRRHAFTGAFGHPKYGGNVSAAGWAYLKSHFPFEWERSVESPLGSSLTYRG